VLLPPSYARQLYKTGVLLVESAAGGADRVGHQAESRSIFSIVDLRLRHYQGLRIES
jgi:hypothetical protein